MRGIRLLTAFAAVAAAMFVVPSATAVPEAVRTAAPVRYPVITGTGTYGTGAYQKVSIYRPDLAGRRPVAFMIHGGGWIKGSRGQWDAEAREWASRGWVVINLDYTRGIRDGVPGDGRQMVADVQTVVKKYAASGRVERNKMIIMGDSAGGHLATLTGAAMHGWFKGVIAWSPVAVPANAVADGIAPGATAAQADLGLSAREFFGYSQRTTSALAYIKAYPRDTPPMLIIASERDFVTYQHQGAELCLALAARCTSRVVPGSTHGTAIRDGDASLAEYARSWALAAIRQ